MAKPLTGTPRHVHIMHKACLSIFVFSVLLTLIGLQPAVAQASPAPSLIARFGESGAGSGQVKGPRGIAINSLDGDAYLDDQFNQRVDEFGPYGEFLRAWGWGVVDGTDAPQVCTTTCQTGVVGGGPGQFDSPYGGIAVEEATGDVYLMDILNHRVEKFGASGEFILTFGGHVNKTTGEDICTAASHNECGVGTAGTAAGEFDTQGVGSMLAVDGSGDVWVGDLNRVQEFSASGEYIGQLSLPGTGDVTALAVGSSGELYVKSEGLAGIREYSSSGVVLDILDAEGSPKAIAVSVDGEVLVGDAGEGEYRELEYTAGGALAGSFGAGLVDESTGVAINSATDTIYVSDFGAERVEMFGAAPSLYGPPPSQPPTIDSEWASAVASDGATLHADINGHFASTTFYIQYVAEGQYEPSATNPYEDGSTAPAPPGSRLSGLTAVDEAAEVSLTDLEPATIYHYRFVARTPGGTTYGPDRTIATFGSATLGLPDDRAVELVSPLEHGDTEVGTSNGDYGIPFLASADGNQIIYPTLGALPGAASSAVDQNIARRTTEGWQTESLSPPSVVSPNIGGSPVTVTGRFEYFEEKHNELTCGIESTRQPLTKLPGGEEEGTWNLFVRDADGKYALVSNVLPIESKLEPFRAYAVVGAAENCKKIIFETGDQYRLLSAAPAQQSSLYEWDEGVLRLDGVLPDGSIAPNSVAGSGENASDLHAVSSNASRVIFTAESDEGIDAGHSEVFLRESNGLSGARTVEASAGTTAAIDLSAQFQAASIDGSRIIFTANAGLTASSSASGTDLYAYDVDAETLEDITPDTNGLDVHGAQVEGVLGVSENASHVYFAATGQLVPGVGNSQAENDSSSEANVYLARTGEPLAFVGTIVVEGALSYQDGGDFLVHHQRLTSRVTPNGEELLFLSHTRPTGYDNLDQLTGEPDAEAYLYSAASGGSLACVSCDPTGTRPLGSARISEPEAPTVPPSRNLSDGGTRLFFDSPDPLLPQATNGTYNVYEYEQGAVYILDDGTGEGESRFAEASSNGEDAFVLTDSSPAGAGISGLRALYDVRVGGGFTAPNSLPSECTGEGCQGQIGQQRVFGPPNSQTFMGVGNVTHHGSTRKACKRLTRPSKRRRNRPDQRRRGLAHKTISKHHGVHRRRSCRQRKSTQSAGRRRVHALVKALGTRRKDDKDEQSRNHPTKVRLER